jgi:hypothetical protein
MSLPGESCQTNEAFTWKARFGDHYNKYSAEAYQIFCTFEIKYPVVSKPAVSVPLDVLGVMDAIKVHYQKLDDFGKWCVSKSVECLEI